MSSSGPLPGARASARRRFTNAILAREVLRDAALTLHARGIPLMPLKGILFQRLLYADPVDRLLSDVDVLVKESDFGAAIEALCGASFRVEKRGRSLIEVALRSPRGLALDLHRCLFSRARYRLSTEGVFARASRDDGWFGVPLYIAHPADTAAHLVGKFVSDHTVTERLPRLDEFLRWVEKFRIQAADLARHLERHGLARAARYTFRCGAEVLGDPFFSAALTALPRDPIGSLCVSAAHSWIARGEFAPLARVSAHLLNSSLPRAAASVAWSGINRWRHARGG